MAFKDGQLVTTFDNLPDVPLARFQLKLNGGPTGALTANSDLCAKALGLDAEFVSHTGKTVAGRKPIEVVGCTAAEKAALRPTATARLTKLKSGKPVMKVIVRKAKNGVKLTGARVYLPSSVKGSAKAAKKGLRILAGGKKALSRKMCKTTSKTLTIKLPKAGRDLISLTASKGAVKPTKKLRRAKKLPKLKIRIKVTDTDNRTFTLSVPVKASKK